MIRGSDSQTGTGFALTVALLVVVAISLAASQVVRAVDTATTITGNLVLRAEAIAVASVGIEQSLAMLEGASGIPDREQDRAMGGYYASRLPGEDARGIPRALQGARVNTSIAARLPAMTGTTLSHVVERLCLAAGPAVAANCVLVRPPAAAGTGAAGPAATDDATTLYRSTVRVDGPRGAVVIVQALARDGPTLQRLSWRIIAE